jgi:hypothetical protein
MEAMGLLLNLGGEKLRDILEPSSLDYPPV